MNIEYVKVNGTDIAVVSGDQTETSTSQAALDLAMTARYEAGAERSAIDKRALGEGFFILSTGVAGEILQKFVSYHVKAAVFGDCSGYTSKPFGTSSMSPTRVSASFSSRPGRRPWSGWPGRSEQGAWIPVFQAAPLFWGTVFLFRDLTKIPLQNWKLWPIL